MTSINEAVDQDLWDRSEWIRKYGLDFVENYGEVNRESIKKFLNIGNDRYRIFMESIQHLKNR